MPFRAELKRPDLKGAFACSICGKIFCHSSSLSRHRMQAHFKSYTCTLCDNEIASNETLRAHMLKSHQISRMFMCRCCNWAFPDKTSLHIHMQSMASGNPANVSIIAKGGAMGAAMANEVPRSSEDEPGSEPSTPVGSKEFLHSLLFNNSGSFSTSEGPMEEDEYPKVDASGVGSLGGTLCLTEEEEFESDGNNNSYRRFKRSRSDEDEEEEVKVDSDEDDPSPKRKDLLGLLSQSLAAGFPTFLQKTKDDEEGAESLANTASSESPPAAADADKPAGCFNCQIMKGRLALSENRNKFLEGKVLTCESKVSRLQSRMSSMDSNIRRYESEGSNLRDQNDSLQSKILQCQEKALGYLQKGVADPDTTQKFLAEILQATYLGAQ